MMIHIFFLKKKLIFCKISDNDLVISKKKFHREKQIWQGKIIIRKQVLIFFILHVGGKTLDLRSLVRTGALGIWSPGVVMWFTTKAGGEHQPNQGPCENKFVGPAQLRFVGPSA